MSKTLTITISDEMWEAFQDAVAGQGRDVDCEAAAQWCMYQAIDRRIKDHKHPETGLSKQQMTHYREGQSAALSWLRNGCLDRATFEEAGRTWASRRERKEHIREALLQGWMGAWERRAGRK